MKLHLGSGRNLIPGWINIDGNPSSGAIIKDLRNPLDYANDSVFLIYSEHFIEHLDEVDGFNLMRECYRVLKPGGVMRISCPDLQQYVQAYLSWDSDGISDHANFNSGSAFLNYAILGEAREGIKYLSKVRQSQDHGHRYYYDERDMRAKLTAIGYVNIKRVARGVSDHIELRNIESRPAMRDLIVEASKKG